MQNENKRKIKEHDLLLRKFKYGEVADIAFESDRPDLTISILQELVLRNGLKDALSSRDPQSVVNIIKWLSNKIHNPKYKATVLPISCMIVDMYSAVSTVSTELLEAFIQLSKEVEDEYIQQAQALQIIGIIDFLLPE